MLISDARERKEMSAKLFPLSKSYPLAHQRRPRSSRRMVPVLLQNLQPCAENQYRFVKDGDFTQSLPYYLRRRMHRGTSMALEDEARLFRGRSGNEPSRDERDILKLARKRTSGISAPMQEWCRLLGYTVCPRSAPGK